MHRPPSALAKDSMQCFRIRNEASSLRPHLAWTSLALGLLAPLACAPASFLSTQQNWTNAEDGMFGQCPAPIGASVGDGPMWLQVAPSHLLCAEVRSSVDSVLDVLARKTQFHLVEGDYFLPTAPGTYDLPLQFCAILQDDKLLRVDDKTPGSLVISAETVLGNSYLKYRYEKKFHDEQDQAWQFIWRLEGYEQDFENGIRIGMEPWNFATPQIEFLLCRSEECADSEDIRALTSCSDADWRLERHRFAYASGQVEFDVRAEADVWPARSKTQAARGEHRGQAFEVTDYWQLDSRLSEPWDNARDLVVRFDAPIDETCALVIRYAHPYPNASWSTEVFEVDCEDSFLNRRLESADWYIVETEDENNTANSVDLDAP